MSNDFRTLRLAYRPVTAEALAAYLQWVELELAGASAAQALKQAQLPADEVTRIAAAVSAFCQPRLLRARLAQAAPKSVERQQKQQQTLAAPIDDSDFIALYGAETWTLFQAREEELVRLRTRVAFSLSKGR
jgi:hypothetical protein